VRLNRFGRNVGTAAGDVLLEGTEEASARLRFYARHHVVPDLCAAGYGRRRQTAPDILLNIPADVRATCTASPSGKPCGRSGCGATTARPTTRRSLLTPTTVPLSTPSGNR